MGLIFRESRASGASRWYNPAGECIEAAHSRQSRPLMFRRWVFRLAGRVQLHFAEAFWELWQCSPFAHAFASPAVANPAAIKTRKAGRKFRKTRQTVLVAATLWLNLQLPPLLQGHGNSRWVLGFISPNLLSLRVSRLQQSKSFGSWNARRPPQSPETQTETSDLNPEPKT